MGLYYTVHHYLAYLNINRRIVMMLCRMCYESFCLCRFYLCAKLAMTIGIMNVKHYALQHFMLSVFPFFFVENNLMENSNTNGIKNCHDV